MAYLGHKPAVGENNSFRILDDISSFVLTFDGSSASVVGLSDETITITENNHRFITGQRVTYSNGGGGNITGLVNGQAYFVINHSKTQIKLASSASNALAGTAINLTALGTGSSHKLTLAFDGVNTKFDPTFGNGMHDTLIKRAAQLVISINGVIQQPHDTATPTTGFGVDSLGHIIFSTAPVSTDIFWGHILASNTVTFDSSDNDVDTFTGNGSTTSFTLSKVPPDNRNILVTIDGVVQYPSDAANTRSYNVSENVMTFTAAPGLGTVIQVRHIGYAGVSGGGGGGVTGFYGRTGNVSLQATDNIVANNATFSGNVSIAQTLTYEDVTDIDAIGLITARSGINVSGGDVVIANDLDLNGNLDVAGISTFDSAFFPNNKKLKFGNTAASPYTEIVHSPSDNYTDIVAIGGTIRVAAEHVSFSRETAAGTQQFIFCDGDNGGAGIGNVNLYQNGDRKLRTLGNGVQVESATGDTYLNVKSEEDSATADAIFLSRVTNSGASSYLMFGDSSDTDVGRIRYNHSNDSLSVKTNAVDNRIFIKSDGNIGLGTASPDHNLHVHSSSGDSVITIESTGNGSHSALEFFRTSSGGDSKGGGSIYVTGDTSSSVSKMKFGVAYNIGHGVFPRMTIEGQYGRVGIGTESPTDILDVYSTTDPCIRSRSGSSSVGALMEICGGSSNDSTLVLSSGTTLKYQFFRDGSQSDDLRIYDSANSLDIIRYRHGGYLHFGVNGEERLRITSSGQVGIGTVPVSGDQQNLTIHGDTNYIPGIRFKQAGVSKYRIMIEGGTGHTYHDAYADGGDIVFRTNAGQAGGADEKVRITEEGNVGVKTTAPQSKFEVDGRIRILDNNDSTPSTGKGLEISYFNTADMADILSYDRGGASYKKLQLRGSSVELKKNNTVLVNVGTGGNNASVGFSTTVNLVTNSEAIAVRGYSSFKSPSATYAAIYTNNELNNTGVLTPHILFNNNGANRGGFGYHTDNNSLIMANHTNIMFKTGATQLGGTERLNINNEGKIGINTNTFVSGNYKESLMQIKAPTGWSALGIGATNMGIRFGYDGDASAYDDIRIYRVDYTNAGIYGIAGNLPCFVLTPTSAPGSGIVQETVWLKSTGRGSGNAEMNLMVDGDVCIGGDGQEPGGSQSGYPESIVGGRGKSKLTIQPDDRTTAFAASDGDTWHDVILKQSGSATNNAVGIAFETSTSAYHKNAGTGIAAVKNGTNSDYGSDLVFITRPQSAVAAERLRIKSDGEMQLKDSTVRYENTGGGFNQVRHLEFPIYFSSGTTHTVATIGGSLDSGFVAFATLEYIGLYGYADQDMSGGVRRAYTRRTNNNTQWRDFDNQVSENIGENRRPDIEWDSGVLKVTTPSSTQITGYIRITAHAISMSNFTLTRN